MVDFKKLPPLELLNELFEIKDGFLIRKKSRSNSVKAGQIAGCINGRGYNEVRIGEKLYLVHRVIWKMVHGKDPVNVIDHINMCKTDNRIENLRDVTFSTNCLNKGIVGSGVSWSEANSKWVARIKRNGVSKHIGYFKNKSSAIIVRKFFENKHDLEVTP